MLVVTRRVGEEIVIDGTIRIKVVAVGIHHIRLGIIAPKNITVNREEVHRRKAQLQDANAE